MPGGGHVPQSAAAGRILADMRTNIGIVGMAVAAGECVLSTLFSTWGQAGARP